MRRLFGSIILLFGFTLCSAQIRSYSDNASGTFVIGLDNYFYGESGSLDFEAAGRTFRVSVAPSAVQVDGRTLCAGGDVVVGIHDFTEDRVPELVVARRRSGSLEVTVYGLQAGSWQPVGSMNAGQGATEVRVFRQVVSIRSGSVLSSWTWHGSRFDYKSSE